MYYWLHPRTWLQKIIGWTTYAVLLAGLPFAVSVSLVYNFFRSLWCTNRVVRDNVVVVTGASSGIGEYIALEYAKRGARLVLAARREGKLKEVAKKCMEKGARDAAVCPTDISKAEACEHLINFAVETFGRLDVLVNNAGSVQVAAVEEYPSADSFRKTVDGDFWGNILTTKYALEHLRRTRGQVVVTCSVGAFVPYPKQAFYNASKAALLNFYDTLRVEPAGQQLTITIALPGFVKSEMTTKGPRGHIPRWWPMFETEECAKKIVEGAMANRRYLIVPYWYSFNVLFRVFTPDLLEIPPRMFLLGKPPNRTVSLVLNFLLGEETTRKIFQSLTAFT